MKSGWLRGQAVAVQVERFDLILDDGGD